MCPKSGDAGSSSPAHDHRQRLPVDATVDPDNLIRANHTIPPAR
jgi:hypothetical protein